MPTPEIRDLIQNELRRVLIQNHPEYPPWYSSLGFHAKQIIDRILEEDVTPDLILFAQQAPDEEWAMFTFLRMIGGGNPNPAIASVLTNLTLGYILDEVRGFGDSHE
jgi:hypothetical protein